MCETRRVNRAAPTSEADESARPAARGGFRQQRPPRVQQKSASDAPRQQAKDESGEFTQVRRRKPAAKGAKAESK